MALVSQQSVGRFVEVLLGLGLAISASCKSLFGARRPSTTKLRKLPFRSSPSSWKAKPVSQ